MGQVLSHSDSDDGDDDDDQHPRQQQSSHCNCAQNQGQLENTSCSGNSIEVNPNGCSQKSLQAATCHDKLTSKKSCTRCSTTTTTPQPKKDNNNDIKLRNNNKHHSKVSFNPLHLVKTLGKSGKADVEGAGRRDEMVRKLSNVSQHRNIQLLSMKARSERETFVDDLRGRRRSSLINLILGVPSSGPRFCDDLCSLSSRLTNFGIEYFPDYNANPNLNGQWTTSSSVCGSLKSVNNKHFKWQQQRTFSPTQSIISAASSNETLPTISHNKLTKTTTDQCNENENENENVALEYKSTHRRRSSEGSLNSDCAPKKHLATLKDNNNKRANRSKNQSALASIDLTSSLDKHLPPGAFLTLTGDFNSINNNNNNNDNNNIGQPGKIKLLANKRRLNVGGHRFLRRSGSELSLYSAMNKNKNNGNNNNCTWSRKDSLASNELVCVGIKGTCSSSQTQSSESDSESAFGSSRSSGSSMAKKQTTDSMRETKLLIILQVCLPFIFAGFGNMGAGLVLSRLASWDVARYVTTFLVILPPLVGLKGNIEMTLASRLSTLANLNLLDSKYRRQRAYLSNLALILSQAIGLSLFASIVAILCELCMSAYGINTTHHHGLSTSQSNITSLLHPDHLAPLHQNNLSSEAAATLAYHANYSTNQMMNTANHYVIAHQHKREPLDMSVQVLLLIASALTTSLIVVILSSIIMSIAILLAKFIQVNPDNLSTLIAALYGDCSFVLIYGLIASSMYKLMITHRDHESLLIESINLYAPSIIIACIVSLWPILLFSAYKFKETHSIALSSLPPMLVSIMISMGSGAVLSVVVKRFALLALYQPIVNGFSANLVAVQASRVSTWLWCSAIDSNVANHNHNNKNIDQHLGDRKSKILGSLASFVPDLGNNFKVAKIEHNELNESTKKDGYRMQQLINCTKNLIFSIKRFILHKVCWSFTNKSPNSIAARMLLIMLIPAHTLYFLVIWLLFSSSSSSSTSISTSTSSTVMTALTSSAEAASKSITNDLTVTTIHLTWSFYLVYLSVCIIQVFILFLLCEPFMTLLMKRGHDPDIIGISILMALADFTGTLFLTGAFYALHAMGDINAR